MQNLGKTQALGALPAVAPLEGPVQGRQNVDNKLTNTAGSVTEGTTTTRLAFLGPALPRKTKNI